MLYRPILQILYRRYFLGKGSKFEPMFNKLPLHVKKLQSNGGAGGGVRLLLRET